MTRFRDALAAPGLQAIAEVKRRSPSAGDLRPDADPAALAPAFAAAGAAACSILVDERFGGSFDDLRAARAATELPLLAKGFFTEEAQLRACRDAGADAALLLLRDLDDTRAAALIAAAAELGLETLVEAHDADELDRAVALGAPVIGLNARDLSSFAIDRASAARARRARAARPRDRRRERRRLPRQGRRGGARRRGRDPGRQRADARPGPGREALRAAPAPAREGLRPDARGGRGRRRRGGRRPRRVHPREGEPAHGSAVCSRFPRRCSRSPSTSAR